MKGSAAFISISSEFRPKDYPNYPNGVLFVGDDDYGTSYQFER